MADTTLTRAGVHRSRAIRPTSVRPNPFRGLAPFEEADAPDFVGRTTESEVLAANILAYRLTVVYGPTGVGKSSLLRAGVMPRLRRHAADRVDEERCLVPVLFDAWAGDPSLGLATAIRQAARSCLPPRLDHGSLPPPSGLPPVIAAIKEANALRPMTFLVLLDQFEEYFNDAHKAPHQRFGEQFVALATEPSLRVNLLLSLREDALARLDHFKGRVPELLDNRIGVGPITEEAARLAIRRPVERQNAARPDEPPVTIDEGLIDTVMNEVRAGIPGPSEAVPGATATSSAIDLPFLQLVMNRLWAAEILSGSRQLTTATLERLGGAQAIVRSHLDAQLEELPTKQQWVAANVLRHLITPSGMKLAVSVPDLAEMAGEDPEEVGAVLHRLAEGDARLLRTVAAADDATYFEIYHDALAAPLADLRTRHRRASRWARTASRFAWLTLLLGPLAFIAVLPTILTALMARRIGGSFRSVRRRARFALAVALLWGLPWTVLLVVGLVLDQIEDQAPTVNQAARTALPVDDPVEPAEPPTDEVTEVALFIDTEDVLVAGHCFSIEDADAAATFDDPTPLSRASCAGSEVLELAMSFDVTVGELLFLEMYNRCGESTPGRLGIPTVQVGDVAGEHVTVHCFVLRE